MNARKDGVTDADCASNVINVDFAARRQSEAQSIDRHTTIDADTINEMLGNDGEIDEIVDAFIQWREDLAHQRLGGQPVKPAGF